MLEFYLQCLMLNMQISKSTKIPTSEENLKGKVPIKWQTQMFIHMKRTDQKDNTYQY